MPLTGWNNNDYFELGVSLDIDYYAEDGVFYGDKVIDYAESFNTNMSGFYLNDSVRYLNSSGYWWSSLASYYSAPALRVDYYGGSNNLVIYVLQAMIAMLELR